MNISVIGHGHLAYVTSACMEQFHKVNVDESKVQDSEIVWVCYDTPVNYDGKPDVDIIFDRLSKILPSANKGTIVIVSTQVPVGTCRKLQQIYPDLILACYPENLRRGRGVNDFMNQSRIVMGCPTTVQEQISRLLAPLNAEILWMNLESAEMVKHALNSFLAMSIAFINEINQVAVQVGASSNDITAGLQSDKRIGKLSYLKAGDPYTNETLGREIHNLIEIGNKYDLNLNLIPAIKKSNDEHPSYR